MAIALPMLPTFAGSFNKVPMIAGHIIALAYNLSIFKDFSNSEGKMMDAKMYYRSVWNLFYGEYLLYLLI